jgi:hypothetical protein
MAIQVSNLFVGGIDSGYFGTGKRASYALVSYNTSQAVGGFAWYGPNFNSVANFGYEGTYNSQGFSPTTYLDTNSNLNYSSSVFIGTAQPTQSYPSSSSANWLSGTNSCGEFGNAMIDAYSDGTFSNIHARRQEASVKHSLNACAINSDHSNRRIVYLLISGKVRAVDRLYGSHANPMDQTSDFVVSSLNASMQGSASYHKVRKELTILSFVANGGSFNCFTFSNVDFDAYPDPAIALNRPEVTRTNATLSLATSWAVNDVESYYNLKPIVADNGNVYVSVMFTSNNFSLYKFTRSGTSAITATRPGNIGLFTGGTYGAASGGMFGQRTITSRDGTTVAAFCPSYYYSAGIACYMIDKTYDTYATYNVADSQFGYQCLPEGDSSWSFYYANNGYAANYSAAYVAANWVRLGGPSGGFNNIGATIYLPYFPAPNTTNYPGMTQVVDYVLLPPHLLGAKNT